MDKNQEKFFKLLKLLDDCRNKLRATYNLFISCLEQTKSIKVEVGSLYTQLLDCQDEVLQLQSSKKPVKTRLTKCVNAINELKTHYEELINQVDHCMDDCENCRKTYKHEVNLCCQTYKALKYDGISASIIKGYKQQVKLIRAILNKIDEIKGHYKNLKMEIKQEKEIFMQTYKSIEEKIKNIKY